MILKSITLHNIRSYADEELTIPEGITLFEGDIASGKSTILYAIELALFGLGNTKPSYLLRNGAKEGSVKLVFESDGSDYEIYRKLVRRGEKIEVKDCYIQKGETRTPLSTTELKERVLDIIKFNEPPNPRAQSVIYRYAIFTPQEEMKEVLLRDDDERLETLRKAFRLEEYSVATENSGLLSTAIGKQSAFLEGASSGLEDDKEVLRETREEITGIESDLGPLRDSKNVTERKQESKKTELEELEKKKTKMSKAEERVPLLRAQIKGKNEEKDRLSNQNITLTGEIEKILAPKIKDAEAVPKLTDRNKDELRKEKDELSENKSALEQAIAKLEERISNFDTLGQTHTCPVCERPIDSADFTTRSSHLSLEKEEKVGLLRQNKGRNTEIEKLIEALEKYEKAQSALGPLLELRSKSKRTIEENNEQIQKLLPEISKLQGELSSSEEEMKPLQEVIKQIGEVQRHVTKLETDLNDLVGKISAKEERANGLRENETKLLQKIATKDLQWKKRDSLNEHRSWLTDYFVPTVQLIEQQSLVQINMRFNQQFQKWFQILLDDPDLQARVDETFTPIIEREGYKQEFQTLSGGEKTSVALAYRLALNMLVQEVSTGTNNLLILDEPTDGFSKEQLSKVRDVLNQLDCPQVILVSHEDELEAFADQVIKVSKKDGVSHVAITRAQE